MIATALPFVCFVTSVHDGDTFTCADGTRVRTAGVDANELNGSCHNQCAVISGDEARVWLDRLIYRKRLVCRPLDRSYDRVVARCQIGSVDLSCKSFQVGAAVIWDRYWRKYDMGDCRRVVR